jgi:hypothetical protein
MSKNKRTEGKIPVHYGMRDYYKFFKKDNPGIKISKGEFSEIVSKFNIGLIDLIIENNLEYALPHVGATLSIKKTKSVPRIKDGKLYNPTPVDWVATNKLWDEDEEAKEKKLLVRYLNNHTSKYVFKVSFKKNVYPFMNKKYYSYKSSRYFSRRLAKRIKDEDKDKYDSFLLY